MRMATQGSSSLVLDITNGLEVYDMVYLKGTTWPVANKVVIELTNPTGVVNGKLLSDAARSEIPFRCTFSFDGSWELLGRVCENRVHLFGRSDYQVSSGEEFTIQIVAYSSRFVMYHDEEEILALNYLVPLSSISHVALSGEASFTDVEFMDSHDFLKRCHPAMLDTPVANSLDSFDGEAKVGFVQPIRKLKIEPHASPRSRSGIRRSRLIEEDSCEEGNPMMESFGLGGSLQSVAMSNPALFDKLYSGALINLQQIELGVCERSPVPIRVGREICISGRLSTDFETFYVAISTVSNRHVAKLLQGEVTLLVSVQLKNVPLLTAYLLHGPVYTELSKQTKLPVKLAPGEPFSVSIHYLYKFITIYINGYKFTNYNYNFFEQADRNLRFPFSQLHFISVWGDVEKSFIKFHYPESLLMPHFNSLVDNLTDYDRPEIRLHVVLHKTTNRVCITMQQGEIDVAQSGLVVRCIVDVAQTVALFETEKNGRLYDSKSIHFDQMRLFPGLNEFAIQLDLPSSRLSFYSNKVLVGFYDERVSSLDRLTHVTIDGDFILRSVEYFPKERKVRNPCCECVVL